MSDQHVILGGDDAPPKQPASLYERAVAEVVAAGNPPTPEYVEPVFVRLIAERNENG